ncbi:Uncharacterized protein SCF082_LOCUS4325, partial [Durusdinium trenchii]
ECDWGYSSWADVVYNLDFLLVIRSSGVHYKGDFTDPPTWPGWSHRKYWVQAVRRWDKSSDLPVHKRAEKVLRSFGWELQPDFEHVPESVLASSAYLDVLIEILNNKAGVREDDEKRRAFKAALMEQQRRRDETLAQFAVRRQRDFTHAASFGVAIPEAFRATMLREGAGLSEQNQQNLVALLQGHEDEVNAVAKALSKLDVRSDRIAAFSEVSPGVENFMSSNEENPDDDVLEFLGAEISLPNERVNFKKLGVSMEMKRLSSGHRTISLFSWEQGIEFPIPPELVSKYQLSSGDFNLVFPSAYMKESSSPLRTSSSVLSSSLAAEDCSIDPCFEPNHNFTCGHRLLDEDFTPDCSHVTQLQPAVQTLHVRLADELPRSVALVPPQLSGSTTVPMGNVVTRNSQFAPVSSLHDAARLSNEPGGDHSFHRAWMRLLENLANKLEANREGYKKLVKAELRTKSTFSNRTKYLDTECQNPGRCIHPSNQVVDQAMAMMQVQGTQFAQALTSINQSLQELARGQSQMILMNQANREMTEAAQELLMQTQGAMPMEEDQWSTVATEVQPSVQTELSDFGLGDTTVIVHYDLGHADCDTGRHVYSQDAISISCSESGPEQALGGSFRLPDHDPEQVLKGGGHHGGPGLGPEQASVTGPEQALGGVSQEPLQRFERGEQPRVCDSLSQVSSSLPPGPAGVQDSAPGRLPDTMSSSDASGEATELELGPPPWIPTFLQKRRSSTLDPQWSTIWCRVMDEQTKAATAMTEQWGAPQEFLERLMLADENSPILGFSETGKPSTSGPFWAFRSALGEDDIDDGLREISFKAHEHDLRQCHRNLSWLTMRMKKMEDLDRLDFVELFSPSRVAPYVQRHGLQVDSNLIYDITAGWDARKKACRQSFRAMQRKRRPRVLMASPECKAFSQLRHINKCRADPQHLCRVLSEGLLMWNFSLEAVKTQIDQGSYFGLEHPAGAASWSLPSTQQLLRRPDVALITFDQCAFNLSVVPDGTKSRKATKVATNNPWLAYELFLAQCQGDHPHKTLIGGLPRRAQAYPSEFCEVIAISTKKAILSTAPPSFMGMREGDKDFAVTRRTPANHQVSFFGEDDEEDDNHDPALADEESPEQDGGELPKLTMAQRRLVQKVHVNTGHPDRVRMLRAFKAAGALPQVLRYIRDEFNCEDCSLKQGPDNRRRAQLPRTFAFNRVLCVDYLYVKFKGTQVPILNMVDAGTSFQIAVRAPEGGTRGGTPSSSSTWRLFVQTWMRYFGAPQMLICDAGNEFKANFERGLELCGILQHVILPECPWQNGRAERHGGWLKNRLDAELHGGRCNLETLEELDEFLASLTSVKNRWLCRGGYTPAQLVFGELPRIPGDLLAEDELGLHGLHDAHNDPSAIDEAAGEYRRRHEIRERARQLAMQQSSTEAIQRSRHAATHQQRHWSPGQWVYVFRRAKPTQDLHLRSRWVGPGVVVLANNDTVYVGMRSRLWRCSPEQIRAALPSEVLGRDLITNPGLGELLRQVVSGTHTGAVDVSKEGPPEPEDHLGPVRRDEAGVVARRRLTRDQACQMNLKLISVLLPPKVALFLRDYYQSSADLQRGVSQESEESNGRSRTPPPSRQIEPIEEEPAAVEERPAKTARVESTTAPSLEPAPSTRAPGTPIGGLMSRIPRQSSPSAPSSSSVPTPLELTPGETLPLAGRVAHQVDEFNQLSSRRHAGDEDETEHQLWRGTYFNYQLGDEALSLDGQGNWTYLTKRNDEVSLKDMNEEDKKLFDASDDTEWNAILGTKAVHVIVGEQASAARRRWPDRILSSRMVRRRKPQPELHSWKAKSRWCVHGHRDPDTAEPQSEGLAMFLQVAVNEGMLCSFADVKNAFCQSRRLNRAAGPLFAEPCEGLKLPSGALISIDAPVYGLDDAPFEWRMTVTDFLVNDLQFERNLVEPCWFSRFEAGKLKAQIMVEVDDFIVAAGPEEHAKIKKALTTKFHFGKWEDREAEYAGRHIRTTAEAIYIDQGKYITEQIHPIPLARGRRSQADSPLTSEEFQALRSLIYKINWVARESRPEASGLASLMAGRLGHALVSDVAIVNKFVNFLRSTASRPLILWRYDPEEMCFIACSDAGGINVQGTDQLDEDGLPQDATQGAWMVLAAERLPEGKRPVRASPITWRSSKLKRKVFSTFGGETQAMLQGVNEVDWLQIMYRDATKHDVQLSSWRNSLSPHMVVMRGHCTLGGRQQQCSVTDAKSLFDCLLRENPSGKQDRKSSLELAIILRDLQDTRSMVRWVPHQKMLVDCMTKLDPMKANDAMTQFLRSGWLSLVDISEELDKRKDDPTYKRRSHLASKKRLLNEYEGQMSQFLSHLILLANKIGGDCNTSALDTMTTLDQKDPHGFHV